LSRPGSGEGAAILLLHGINGCGSDWEAVIEALPARRAVVALDYRGHGRSVRAGPYGLDEYVADAMAVVAHLGLSTWHVVGTSFGTHVAVACAARWPGLVQSVTAVSSALEIGAVHDIAAISERIARVGVDRFFREVLPRYSLPKDADADLIDRLVRHAANNDVATVVDIVRTAFGHDAHALCERVGCPAVVVHGSDDKTCSIEGARALAAALAAPLIELPGVAHMAPIEAPEAVAEAIMQVVALAETVEGAM
jgi:pyruvate dehydrogenase E2 component (dihydrolipoamide acetyltransferase)